MRAFNTAPARSRTWVDVGLVDCRARGMAAGSFIGLIFEAAFHGDDVDWLDGG